MRDEMSILKESNVESNWKKPGCLRSETSEHGQRAPKGAKEHRDVEPRRLVRLRQHKQVSENAKCICREEATGISI